MTLRAHELRRPRAAAAPADSPAGATLPTLVAAPLVVQDAQAAAAGGGNPHFDRIGGAAAIRRLCDSFYANMDTLPEARHLRTLHPPDLTAARETLYKYLVGWTGGPPLYTEQYGPPRLRQRHLPFAIGDTERDAWMRCMTLALQEVVADAGLRAELGAAFFKVATFLRNR